MLWPQSVTPGVIHFGAYHRPPDGHFFPIIGQYSVKLLAESGSLMVVGEPDYNLIILPPPLYDKLLTHIISNNLSHRLWNQNTILPDSSVVSVKRLFGSYQSGRDGSLDDRVWNTHHQPLNAALWENVRRKVARCNKCSTSEYFTLSTIGIVPEVQSGRERDILWSTNAL